ncbi:MAG: hypothetical protein H0X30_32865 [Anaerolineae bacterium]|nr:hypothetical protein [Anaerolineae bacterium]
MLNMVLERVLINGTLFSVIVGVLVMGSLWYNPRLWLQDYPKVVQAKVPPMSPHEKLQQRFIAIPFLLLMLGVPFVSVLMVKAANGGSITFPFAYLTAVGVLQLFNLFDALVLDYLLLTVMQPSFAIIPGTTREESLVVGWAFQVRNFVKGIVITALLSLPIAFLASL